MFVCVFVCILTQLQQNLEYSIITLAHTGRSRKARHTHTHTHTCIHIHAHISLELRAPAEKLKHTSRGWVGWGWGCGGEVVGEREGCWIGEKHEAAE